MQHRRSDHCAKVIATVETDLTVMPILLHVIVQTETSKRIRLTAEVMTVRLRHSEVSEYRGIFWVCFQMQNIHENSRENSDFGFSFSGTSTRTKHILVNPDTKLSPRIQLLKVKLNGVMLCFCTLQLRKEGRMRTCKQVHIFKLCIAYLALYSTAIGIPDIVMEAEEGLPHIDVAFRDAIGSPEYKFSSDKKVEELFLLSSNRDFYYWICGWNNCTCE